MWYDFLNTKKQLMVLLFLTQKILKGITKRKVCICNLYRNMHLNYLQLDLSVMI
ncbi:hypothetical protein M107_0544 [Bacteroides fragilis str. 3725 D9(v)]|nr:hypothetical protein M107_0544 [Bacteroides fragilis str. 3725 D9(v)]